MKYKSQEMFLIELSREVMAGQRKHLESGVESGVIQENTSNSYLIGFMSPITDRGLEKAYNEGFAAASAAAAGVEGYDNVPESDIVR